MGNINNEINFMDKEDVSHLGHNINNEIKFIGAFS